MALPITERHSFAVRYSFYVGDGNGANGHCMSIGSNDLGTSYGEGGVRDGVAVCFDEWENSISIMFNGLAVWEESVDGGWWSDSIWHTVDVAVQPTGEGGATVRFTWDNNDDSWIRVSMLSRGGAFYGGWTMIPNYQLPSRTYLGFTARNGGHYNNHWVKEISTHLGDCG